MKIKSTFIFLLISTIVFSQKSFEIGIESGVSFSKIRTSIFDKNDFKTNFVPNITIEYFVTSRISIKTSLGLESKGANVEEKFTLDNGVTVMSRNTSLDIEYITVPVLVKYSSLKKTGFFINIGPHFNFLLNSNRLVVKETDFGITTGVGFFRRINKFKLSGEIRNSFGLTNIADYDLTKPTIKNNSFYLLAGINYAL